VSDAGHLPIGASLAQGRVAAILEGDEGGVAYLVQGRPGGADAVVEELLPPSLAMRTRSGVRARDASLAEPWERVKAAFRDYADGLLLVRHPALAAAESYFERDGTGYLAYRAEESGPLEAILALGALKQNHLDELLAPVLGALRVLHEQELIHRNLTPVTIRIRPNGAPLLTRAAGWRGALKAAPGTASPYWAPDLIDPAFTEDPRSDLYALAAVLYFCITGQPPPTAKARLDDDRFVPVRSTNYRSGMLAAINGALELEPLLRPNTAEEFLEISLRRAASDTFDGPPSRRSIRSRMRELDRAPRRLPNEASVPTRDVPTRPSGEKTRSPTSPSRGRSRQKRP
jgi:serine/threonine protein kinase